ncbi:MAG: branched-chain amino acid ABC transporter permease [Chloroflexota bacterium]|nr:branched-chain amino acid ABC transporter permease [Chloroflexota bacterium]MDE2885184.1 branched-chain amino acid ABC transporter permease [Chloroflexota bacterium]
MFTGSRRLPGLKRSVRDPGAFIRLARSNLELWANLVIIAWAVTFAILQGTGFAITLGTVFAIWAILAVSLNLVVGFTGLLSVGHIGFFGIGAYTVAVLTSNASYEQLRTEAIPTFGWPFFAALPVGVVLAGLTAVAVGVVFNRFRDDIFVLVSFGFAIICFNVFLNARAVTRGAFGIHEVAKPQIGGWVFDDELSFLALAVVFLLVVVLLSWFIVTSSFGRVLTAIREDERATEVFGYQVTHYKLTVWVLSAMMAAAAGGLFASWTTFIDPNSFVLLESILLVSIVILGGLATIWGSLLGAMTFVLLEEGMRFVPGLPDQYVGQARQVVLGVLLVLLMLFRPQGLLGRYRL